MSPKLSMLSKNLLSSPSVRSTHRQSSERSKPGIALGACFSSPSHTAQQGDSISNLLHKQRPVPPG